MEKIIDRNDHAPRCIECGYILLGLTELRCPECGTEFDPEYVKQDSYRVHLLPWERPEVGGWIKRLARTLMLASLHPSRFYTSVSYRKDRRIRNPVKLILAYILASMCILFVSQIVEEAIGFVWMWAKLGQFSQVWALEKRVLVTTGILYLFVPVVQILSSIIPIGVMAAVIRYVFREKIGSLRYVDMFGLYCPVVALQAFLLLVGHITVQVAMYAEFMIYDISDLVAEIILPLTLWFSCRKFILLSRWKSIGISILGCVVYFVCGIITYWLMQIPLFISRGLL